jgi:hypothetical protein
VRRIRDEIRARVEALVAANPLGVSFLLTGRSRPFFTRA